MWTSKVNSRHGINLWCASRQCSTDIAWNTSRRPLALLYMFHGNVPRGKASQTTSQARDLSDTFKRSFTLPALITHEHVRLNTWLIISATLRYGGEGIALLQLVTISIEKGAPNKFCSWPLQLLDIISKSIHNYSCHQLGTSMQMVRCLSARTIISSLASTGCQWKSFC